MHRLLSLLSRHAALVLAFGVFGGLLVPVLAHWLRPTLPAAVAGLLFLSVLRIDWNRFVAQRARPRLIGAALLWILVLGVALAYPMTKLLAIPPSLAVAVVLAAAAPPIVSGPAIAVLVGLDGALMLALVVVASLLAPFTLAVVATLIPGVELALAPAALWARLAVLIGGCFAAALVVRASVGAARLAGVHPALDAGSVTLLLVFAVAVMDGVPARFAHDAAGATLIMVAAFAVNMVLQLVTGLVFMKAGRRVALTIAFAGGNRNLALLLAVLPVNAAPDLLLFCALAQFPIYLLPALLTPLYRRLLAVSSTNQEKVSVV